MNHLKTILFVLFAIAAIYVIRYRNQEVRVLINNMFNGKMVIDESKYIMTKEKLREIIEYKNYNSEKLKIIKSESGQIKISLSDQKFNNIKM